MDVGTFRVSRFVLALEMLGCFGPLTLGWFAIMFDPSGVAWLDTEIVERYYLPTTTGVVVLATMLVSAVTALAGPFGLVIAARHIVFGKVLRRGWLGRLLVAAPIAGALVYIAANVVNGTSWSVEWAGFYILYAGLPVVGALHLLYLGNARLDAPAATRTA